MLIIEHKSILMEHFKNHGNIAYSHQHVTLKERIKVNEPKPRIIVLAGPTGVGKSNLSIMISSLIGGEIISADSMQIYKHMDIGTAKVTKEDRELIPHHMIDICDVSENFNVVQYYNFSHMICKDILLREKVPILVGGSGFYIHAFMYGPPMGPPSILEVRKKLEKEIETLGPEALYEKLEILDPKYAKSISFRDKHKIVRALEIITITNKPVSSFLKQSPHVEPYDYRAWFLYMPKEVLYSRVEIRCEEMIENGFIEEVELLDKLGIRNNQSAASAIGYKQCLAYLQTNRTKKDLEEFIDSFKKATRHYIKRQFTWFRKEKKFRWLNLYEIDKDRAIEFILQDFEQGS